MYGLDGELYKNVVILRGITVGEFYCIQKLNVFTIIIAEINKKRSQAPIFHLLTDISNGIFLYLRIFYSLEKHSTWTRFLLSSNTFIHRKSQK